MSSRNYATRMSCFSLISSIETDLRNLIVQQLPDAVDDILPEDVTKTAKERYFEHKKEVFSKEDELNELLDFVDFYDLSKILNKIGSVQTFFSKDEIKFITSQLENLSKCRNRVCHSRPLEPNDFNQLLDFTNELIKKGDRLSWKNINEAIKNLNNPSFALSLEIPNFWRLQKKSIDNNLPLPEFDDTGFFGRENDRKLINKLLMSNTKVISIVGEGGIGKTALAQRCLYDILDLCEGEVDKSLYDIIIWVSLKTSRLTSNGVDQIRNAICSSSGLFQKISETLGVENTGDIKSTLDEISEYMTEFNILLCIDNLETISSSEVREFLANIPSQSKVLITTRIGLGEIEYRYKLDKLDDKPSIELMRNMSRLLNLDSLYKNKNDALIQLCKRLYNNPLLIKWYVLAVAAGKSPADLINKQSVSFKDALRFCFENLYDQLGEVETIAISVIACIRKPISAVELRFFLGYLSEIEIEEALHHLHNSSMLVSNSDLSELSGRLYSLTGVAEEYINSVRPVSEDIYKLVKSKRKELQSILDEHNVIKNHYKYDLNAISWSTRDEKICSIYLRKALGAAKQGNLEVANNHVETAIGIMPEFSECYRIRAYILKDSSPYQAEVEFEKSIEFDPKSAITRYAYAQFLIHEEDFDRAEEQIDHAIKLDHDEIALKTCKAWILTLKGNYKDASVLYEELIPNQKSRHRKFRISTYDQASSCYRRMAEQFIRDDDLTEALMCLRKAVNIIAEAIGSEGYDHVTINRLCNLLMLAEVYYKKSNDAGLTIEIFSIIDNNIDQLTVKSLQNLKIGLERYGKECDPQNSYKVSEIISRINPPNASNGMDRILGTVDQVKVKTAGVSYGFINGIDDIRYFFHRGELTPNTLLDDESKKDVTFIPCTYEKGPCAKDIREK